MNQTNARTQLLKGLVIVANKLLDQGITRFVVTKMVLEFNKEYGLTLDEIERVTESINWDAQVVKNG